ncbi:hypothetical protein NMY22_g11557 [Coprinellus aureogranulatus]|nr:hypothetical protein NMY22_g11557 [Coprinellus aureogranulatus]
MPQDIPLPTAAVVAAGVALAATPLALRLLRRKGYPPNCLTNIQGPSGGSFIAGHMTLLFSNDSWDFHQELHDKYGQTTRIKGMLGEDLLFTSDPKAMYHIFVKPWMPKDQHLYEEPFFFTSGNQVLFGPGLLGTTSQAKEEAQPRILSRAFASHGQVGSYSAVHADISNPPTVPTFFAIGDQLCDTFLKKVSSGAVEIDIVTWTTRAALEFVGQSGFGTSFAPLTEDTPEHPYARSVNDFAGLITVTLLPRLLVMPTVQKYNLGGRWLQRKVLDLIPWKAAHQMRDVVDIMHETSVNIFEIKRRALSEEGSDEEQKKSIIGTLVRENMKTSGEDRLTDEEVIAQMSTIMVAALDTTSSSLQRILHLLSIHQDVQDRLRAELRDAYENFGPHPDHDQLVNLPYMDAICRETLRLYAKPFPDDPLLTPAL